MRIEANSRGGFADAHWNAHQSQCAQPGVHTRIWIECARSMSITINVNGP